MIQNNAVNELIKWEPKLLEIYFLGRISNIVYESISHLRMPRGFKKKLYYARAPHIWRFYREKARFHDPFPRVTESMSSGGVGAILGLGLKGKCVSKSLFKNLEGGLSGRTPAKRR